MPVLMSDDLLLIESVFTANELSQYARGRESRLANRPEPDGKDIEMLLGWHDVKDGVSVLERIKAERAGATF